MTGPEPENCSALPVWRPITWPTRQGLSPLSLAWEEGALDVESPVAPEDIYQRVWGYAMAHGDRSVDVFVRKLRSKIEAASPRWSYIHTHFGIGYRFQPEPLEGSSSVGEPIPASGTGEQALGSEFGDGTEAPETALGNLDEAPDSQLGNSTEAFTAGRR